MMTMIFGLEVPLVAFLQNKDSAELPWEKTVSVARSGAHWIAWAKEDQMERSLEVAPELYRAKRLGRDMDPWKENLEQLEQTEVTVQECRLATTSVAVLLVSGPQRVGQKRVGQTGTGESDVERSAHDKYSQEVQYKCCNHDQRRNEGTQ